MSATCPSCGEPVQSGADVCAWCGKELRRPPAPAPPEPIQAPPLLSAVAPGKPPVPPAPGESAPPEAPATPPAAAEAPPPGQSDTLAPAARMPGDPRLEPPTEPLKRPREELTPAQMDEFDPSRPEGFFTYVGDFRPHSAPTPPPQPAVPPKPQPEPVAAPAPPPEPVPSPYGEPKRSLLIPEDMAAPPQKPPEEPPQIGRASCRERV